VIDFGLLAITNQFISDPAKSAFRQPISLCECPRCGVVQLIEVPPVDEIRPRFAWLTQREPEGHFRESAELLIRYAEITRQHRIVGLSASDAGILEQLSGFDTRTLDPAEDLGITAKTIGFESIQEQWTVERARQLAEKYGRADALVVRYVLEHAQDAAAFLEACKAFLAPEGVLLVGVPDCHRDFQNVDVTVLWEQHSLYFTESTLRRSLTLAGFDVLHLQRIADPFEDHLVAICRVSNSVAYHQTVATGELDPVVQRFAEQWPSCRVAIRSWADGIRANGGKIAAFGAGHRACTLIDTTGLSDYLECVIDDSVDKQAFRFPAGNLPIRSSAALVNEGITHCLLLVNLDIENRIIARNLDFVKNGGKWTSYFTKRDW
jgi:hypothetical protein